MATDELQKFEAAPGLGSVSAVFRTPHNATAAYVFAHGAGAGMHHHFMESMSAALATEGIATFRYMFPYTEAGRRRPDHRTRLIPTVRSAVAHAKGHANGLPVFAGGKSMGGRMTSQADAEGPLGVDGLVFLGFPLHPAGKEGTSRAEHLTAVPSSMLFVQGTRDKLADLDLLRPVVEGLGDRATLHVLDQADHGLVLPKRCKREPPMVHAEVAQIIAGWMTRQHPHPDRPAE